MNKIEISNKVPFDCSVNGVKLEVNDLVKLSMFYEASCTAEYLHENYGIEEDVALKLGYEIREMMANKDMTEEEAIDAVFADRNLDMGR